MEHERKEIMSTTWDEIESVVDDRGYRAGFVEIFLEFRGAVLDDQPLDGRGRPEVVNQSNFAKHFGIAISTFHRWLSEFGGEEFEIAGERKEKADEAKARQKTKTGKNDKAAVNDHVRRKVPEDREDFSEKLAVHISDFNLWCMGLDALIQFEDGPAKIKLVEKYLDMLDAETEALDVRRKKMLSWQTEYESSDGTTQVA